MQLCEYFTPIISLLWAFLEGFEAHFAGTCWTVVPPRTPGCAKLPLSLLGPFAKVTAVSLSTEKMSLSIFYKGWYVTK